MPDPVGVNALVSTVADGETPAEGGGRDDLAPGTMIGKRYLISRLIDHGGMGAVYEAVDCSLVEKIALKTIRTERASEPRAIERFKREALLARRVTHRNVCRVFDVGHYEREVFLTMELLAGETLAAKIRRDGKLSPDQALPIVEQMVAGLEAAHAAGVVHRDFKCSNVMLVADRVVVTDFGLAHDVMASGHESSTDGFIGTPAYVAPEQVNGRRVSSASDIYALGVVMFEMVTGTLPWIGATPMASAVMRLHEPAPSATARVPDLPIAWERTIARCLEREPEDRFAGVGEVLESLRSGGPAPRRRTRRQRRLALAGIAIVAAGVGGGLYVHDRGSTVSSELPRNPIAAHLYREAVDAMKRFQPTEARRELEVAAELEPDQPLVYAALAKALHVLKADEKELVAAKKAFELSSHLDKAKRLDIEASYREAEHDWAAAAKLRVARATFYPDNLDYGLALAEAQRRASQRDDALATIARLRRLAPPNGDDPRLDLAEAKLRKGTDPAAAERLLAHAIALAPARGAVGVEADAHVSLCEIEAGTQRTDTATLECTAALAIYEAEHDLSGEATVYDTLASMNVVTRHSAEIEKYSNRALEIYRQIGSKTGELRSKDALAVVYRRAGENAKAEQLWREAITGYREAGETRRMVYAMDSLAATLTDEDKTAEAIPLYRELIKLEDANGLLSDEANTLSNFSIALLMRGELEEAAPLAADAVAKWKQIGELQNAVYGMDSMGQIAMRQGRLADARAIEDEALAARVKLGGPGGPSRQNLANIDLEEHNFERSAALARKAAEEFRTANEPTSELYAHDVLVRALVEQGHLDEAEAAANRMTALAKQVGAARVTTTAALSLLRGIRGDTAGAAAALREALAEDRRKGDVDSEIDHLSVLAEILVKRGSAADARKALAEFRTVASAHGYTQLVRDADALARLVK